MNPDQIKQLREKYGVPTQGYGTPQGTSGNVDRLAKFNAAIGETPIQPVKKFKDTTTGGIVKKTVEGYKQGAERLTTGLESSSKQIQEGIQEGDQEKALGGVARSGLRTVGAVTGATFAPITAGLEQAGEELAKNKFFSDKVAPHVQRIMDKLGNSEGAQKVKDFIEANPEKAQDIADIVDIATFGGGSAAEKPLVKAGKEILDSAGNAIKEPIINAAKKTSIKASELIDNIGIKSEKKAAAKEVAAIQEKIAPKPTSAQVKLATEEGRLIKAKKPTLFREGGEERILPSKKELASSETIRKNIPGAAKMDEPTLYTALKDKTKTMAKELQPRMKETPVKPKTIEKINKDLKELQKKQLKEADFTEEGNIRKEQKQFIERLQKTGSKNMDDLWESAKNYDDSIPDNVKKATELSPKRLQDQKKMWLENRAVLRDAITDNTTALGPEAERAFKEMHDMYNARENLLSKATLEKTVKPSKLRSVLNKAKEHPVVTAGATAIAGYTAAKHLGN